MDYYNNTINNNVFQALKNTLKKINTIPNKFIVIFWFLGPFIYLIERTPGDAWLSIIALLLVIKSIREKNWSWANQPWFKFALLYWIWSLLVACQGPMPLLSLQEGFVWITKCQKTETWEELEDSGGFDTWDSKLAVGAI